MGTELYLKQVSPAQLEQLRTQGLAAGLDRLYEELAHKPDGWLLLDEHIFGFLRHQPPAHATLNTVVMGGTPFPDSAERDDFPRFFAPDEVQALAEALGQVQDGDLARRFDALRPGFGGAAVGGSDEQALARLNRRFQEVVAFYHAAADKGNAVLLLLF